MTGKNGDRLRRGVGKGFYAAAEISGAHEQRGCAYVRSGDVDTTDDENGRDDECDETTGSHECCMLALVIRDF